MVGHLLSLSAATQASKLKRLTSNPSFSTIIRRYKHKGKDGSGGEEHRIDKERARTTAEEFERVAEEKSRQGFSSQTEDKARDAAEEATVGNSEPQHVKQAYKESPETGDFDKTGNSEPQHVKQAYKESPETGDFDKTGRQR